MQKNSQNEMLSKLDNFQEYSPRKPDTIEEKKEVLNNVERLYDVRNKVIEAFEDGAFLFKDRFQEKETDVLNKKLPIWVRVDKKSFNQTKDQAKKVKDKNLYVRPNRGAYINVNHSYELIRDIEYGKIIHKEALNKINKIHSDIERINDQDLVLNTLFFSRCNFYWRIQAL